LRPVHFVVNTLKVMWRVLPILLIPFWASAQIDIPTGIGGNNGPEIVQDSVANSVEYDITNAKLHWFSPSNPFFFLPPDTSIRNFHLYNPAFQLGDDIWSNKQVELQTLGNLGSASNNLDFNNRFANRWDNDLNQNPYSAYLTSWDKLKFYRVNKPYTELGYSLGAAVEQTIRFRHTQNIVPNANFAIDYRRFVSEGELNNHKTGIHDANITSWFQSKSRKYAMLIGYSGGVVKNEENGGTSETDSALFAAFPRTNADVFLTNAVHGLEQHNVRVRQLWNLSNDKPDTVRLTDSTYYTRIVSGLRFWHELSYQTQSLSYFDTDPDISFYSEIIYDEDTTLVEYGLHRYETSLGFGNITAIDRGNAMSHARMRFFLSLHYRYDDIDKTIGKVARQELFAKGWFGLNSGSGQNILIAEGGGQFNQRAEFELEAKAGLNLWPHRITVGLKANRYNPTITQNTFFSNHYVWFNEFENELNFIPELHYRNRNLRTDIKLRYHQIQNYLYWDNEGLPAQAQDGTSLFQILINQDFKLGKFYFENRIALQLTNDAEIDLPLYWGKHSVYYQSHFFGKATFAKIGFDLRMTSEYFANGWNPVAGVFHLQDQSEYIFNPILDVYISARVKTARIFLRGNNITQGLIEDGYFQTPGYVMPSRGLTLGVNWVFWY
jgi:hypothetical protein